MGRSGYSDDYFDEPSAWLWRGAVASAIRGKRGQQFLRDLVIALDALPEKQLIDGDLECNGQVCALGSVGKMRGVPMADIDPYDRITIAETFGIAEALAAEIMYMNDEAAYAAETPAQRWKRVRKWATDNLVPK